MASVDQSVMDRLIELRMQCPFPAGLRFAADQWTESLLGLLFPHLARTESSAREACQQADDLLKDLAPETDLTPFWNDLPEILRKLQLDARAIHYGDPASTGIDEVILTYPGFYATAVYRLAHRIFELGVPILPRLMTEHAHRETGVDIHPGATIGHSFCIDHGTGVVIGGTALVGNGVKIYQGVTLGAKAVARSFAGQKRHPTIQDHVVIYANATILGGETVIGHDAIIGGSAWITHSVPPFSMVGRDSEVRSRPSEPDNLEFHI